MPLKLYIRHLQIYDKNNVAVVYVGSNPSTLAIQPGQVDQHDWIDITEDIDGLEKLKLTWSLKNGARISTGVSGSLTFFDAAYTFVKDWLNDSVSAPLNAVEVKIEDVGCITYTDFLIKADGLRLCSGPACQIDINVKQGEGIMECIRKTAIADNHLGWFYKETTKQHPRFGYCDDFPSWILGAVFATLAIIWVIVSLVFPIIAILCYAVNTFLINKLDCPDFFGIKVLDELFKRLSGCNRQHPAPLVRDYIFNACNKCGVNVNAASVPVFFDSSSLYYNTTYFNPEVKKGIDRDKNGWWIPENEPLLTLDMFLDKLMVAFNSEWRVINNTLYFKRKNDIASLPYLFDFVGADADQLTSLICYEWNGEKKAAYLRGIYGMDSIETTGNEAADWMNDIVDFNNPLNPMLEDNKTIQAEFGMQRYMWDQGDQNYLSWAMLSAKITAAALPLAIIWLNQGKQTFKDFKGYLLMKEDKVSLPKLIIWDGLEMKNARAVRPYGYDTTLPAPNPFYNSQPYTIDHPEDFDSDYNIHGGLYNYPMFFDANFKGNLYENFFQIEDPRKNPLLNKTWDLTIYNCCDNLKRIGVEGDGSNVVIGQKVRLFDSGFYTDGEITEVEVSYGIDEKQGRYIKLKGKI